MTEKEKYSSSTLTKKIADGFRATQESKLTVLEKKLIFINKFKIEPNPKNPSFWLILNDCGEVVLPICEKGYKSLERAKSALEWFAVGNRNWLELN
jgi:hypothetical protein